MLPSVGDGSPITGGAAAPSQSSLYNPFSVNVGSSGLWWQSAPTATSSILSTQNLIIAGVVLVAIFAIKRK